MRPTSCTLLPDWNERSRSAALDADLAELGIPCPPVATAPRLDGEAFLFGVLYVLEGSRLGARLLTRQILANGDPHLRRATRYLRHGEGKPFWQTFLARLEASIAVRRSPERAVAGAVAAFACFAGRLPNAQRPRGRGSRCRIAPGSPSTSPIATASRST